MKKKAEQWIYFAVLMLLVLFLGTVLLRAFTRLILVRRLKWDNAFTRLVFFDNDTLRDPEIQEEAWERSGRKWVSIDWSEVYPFPNEAETEDTEKDAPETGKGKQILSKVNTFKERILSVEKRVKEYTTDYLAGHSALVSAGNRYEAAIGWNFATPAEYNALLELEPNYYIGPVADVDPLLQIRMLRDLCTDVTDAGSRFLYIQAPSKVSREDTEVAGVIDFSNQVADRLLNGLKEADVPYLDLREMLEKDCRSHHSYFYQTDHHWKVETACQAAAEVAEHLGLKAYPENSFEHTLYPEWFLGSQGKKVTLARAVPDDFVLLTPSFETKLHYELPNFGIDEDGDFSLLLDMTQIETKNLYNKNPYGAYIYGDQAFQRIRNHMVTTGPKVLFIHNSFGDAMLPFLTLSVPEMISVDLRHFTGSLQTLIGEEKPDIVLVLYSPGAWSQHIDPDSHDDQFDFR